MSFSISAGVYRYICSNGLIIADSVFEAYKIKHLGERENDVINAVANITAIKPKLLSKISKFESITLNQNEKESFLQSALPLRFENHLELDNPNELLTPLRAEDKNDDLYTVLNILQENFLSSKVSGYNKETNTSVNKLTLKNGIEFRYLKEEDIKTKESDIEKNEVKEENKKEED
jgi:hypothetical protein